MHYCGQCDDRMEGEIRESDEPTFRVGCCFDLEWTGTRDQAVHLYDYLMDRGYINHEQQCRDGCYIEDDDGSYEYNGWKCGQCGASFEEDESYYNERLDEYVDGKTAAVECCKDREAVNG